MIFVLVAMLVSVVGGLAAERRWPNDAQRWVRRVIDFMLWFVLPPCLFLVIARLEVTTGVGVGLLLGYVVVTSVAVIAWLIGSRVLKLPRASTGALIVGAMLANTGYLGLPLILVALGGEDLGAAVAWDTLISFPMAFVFAFAVGAAFGETGGERVSDRVKAFFTRNPVLWAIALGLLAPDSLAPDVLFDAAKILISSLLPIAFFMVGVFLAAEARVSGQHFPPPLDAPIATAVVLRLAVAPALLVALAAFTLEIPDAYYAQAAMPCGINAIIVGHVYGLDLRIITSAIAWSTAIFVIEAAVAAPLL